jgi:hypothetical protein
MSKTFHIHDILKIPLTQKEASTCVRQNSVKSYFPYLIPVKNHLDTLVWHLCVRVVKWQFAKFQALCRKFDVTKVLLFCTSRTSADGVSQRGMLAFDGISSFKL